MVEWAISVSYDTNLPSTLLVYCKCLQTKITNSKVFTIKFHRQYFAEFNMQ